MAAAVDWFTLTSPVLLCKVQKGEKCTEGFFGPVLVFWHEVWARKKGIFLFISQEMCREGSEQTTPLTSLTKPWQEWNQAKQQNPLLQQSCLQSQEQPDLRTSRCNSAWYAELLSRNELEWLISLHKTRAISYCKDLLALKSSKYLARYCKWQKKGTQHLLVSENLLLGPPSLLTFPFCHPSAWGGYAGYGNWFIWEAKPK